MDKLRYIWFYPVDEMTRGWSVHNHWNDDYKSMFDCDFITFRTPFFSVMINKHKNPKYWR